MKHLFTVAFIVCIGSLCQTQAQTTVSGIPIVDAKEIKKLIAAGKFEEATHIIHFYTRDEKGEIIADPNKLAERIKANKLWEGIFPVIFLNRLAADTAVANRKFVESGGAGVQGGLSSVFPASTVADGLGTFIAERFKEELTMRYLENFRKKLLKGDSTYFYSKLLPKTVDALQNYPNVYDYKAFLTVLREAFKDDLDHVGQNILPFLDSNMTASGLNTAEFYISIATFDLFVNQIPQSSNALQAIAEWQQNEYMMKVADSVGAKKILTLSSLFAETLRNNEGYLDSRTDLDAFLKQFDDAKTVQIFLALFVQKNYLSLEKITFSGKTLNTIITETVDDIKKDFKRFHGLLRSIGNIQVTLQEYLNLSPEERKDVLPLLTKLNGDLQVLVKELAVIVPEASLVKVQKTLRFSDHFFTMARFAKEEKYGLVIVEILKTVDETRLRDKRPMLYETLNTYGLFIANVAQAKTGQEVKEALDVAALPVGSYKIKRNALSDISLNAFPGVSFGYEFRKGVTDVPGQEIEDKVGSFAFAAPVGLAFSWGGISEEKTRYKVGAKHARRMDNRNEFKVNDEIDSKTNEHIRTVRYVNGYSHSLFISVIDIGAVTSFRLTDEDTETLPEFTWSNILAPGVFYFLGLKNTPISLGVGAQYGPQLRTITDTDIKVSDSLITARVLLSVDIPIFSFFSRASVKAKNQSDSNAFYK